MTTKPIQYNPSILEEFADQLYSQAELIVSSTTLRYGAITFFVALIFYLPPMLKNDTDITVIIVMTLVIILVTGFAIAAGRDAGKKKAFALKVQAQQMLCQLRIESLLLKEIEPKTTS